MRLLRRALFKERAGNTAMIFALLTPVLVLLGGGAVDLTNASMRQSNLQQAADAAAVGAVARSSPAYQAALLMTGDGTVTASNIQSNALAIFNANRRTSGDTSTPSFNISIVKTGLTVSSTVTASATFAPSFLGLIGKHGINLASTSYASDNIPAYVNFYMLLDNTPSMGLPATSADIQKMENATAGLGPGLTGCAFACHATASGGDNLLAVATANNITMRITEVANATAALMSTATSTEAQNGLAAPMPQANGTSCGTFNSASSEFQVGIYDFGAAAYVAPGLTTVSPLSACLSQSKADAGTVDLMQVPYNNAAYVVGNLNLGVANNDQDTDFPYILSRMAPIVGTAGTGVTSAAPQKVLFIVTDGMTDVGTLLSRSMGSFDTSSPTTTGSASSWCTNIKNAGVKIAILYTTYTKDGPDSDPTGWSQANVDPLLPSIAAPLQACASSGLYYEVNPTNGAISTAMNTLFQNVLASVHITK